MRSTQPRTTRRPPARNGGNRPAFPVWKAFVIQFSGETRSRPGLFTGRVEHPSSGRRARFASPQELVAVLTRMLDRLGEPMK